MRAGTAPAAEELMTGVTDGRIERPEDVALAQRLAAELGGPYVPRRNRGIARLLADEGLTDVIAVADGVPTWRDGGEGTFFFHPNMGVGRLRAIAAGGGDLLARAAGLRAGDRVLDATLGLAADALVASHLVGPSGRVVGLELSPVIAVIVRYGLATYPHKFSAAMRRVEVVQGDHREHFEAPSELVAAGWDVILFDPMFERPVHGSHGLAGIRRLAGYDPVSETTITRARNFASRAVVVKGRRGDAWFESLAPDERVDNRRGRLSYAIFTAG